MQESDVQPQALESERQSPGLSTGRAAPTDQAATQNAPADSGVNIEQTEESRAHNDAEDEAQEMGDYQYLMLETTKASEPQTLAVFMRATHLFENCEGHSFERSERKLCEEIASVYFIGDGDGEKYEI
jgi:hypothetical protein